MLDIGITRGYRILKSAKVVRKTIRTGICFDKETNALHATIKLAIDDLFHFLYAIHVKCPFLFYLPLHSKDWGFLPSPCRWPA